MVSESLLQAAVAGPYFLGGVLLELHLARRAGRTLHHRADSLTSLACGGLMQALYVPARLWVFGSFAYLSQRAAWVSVPASAWWAWPLCFVLMDHQYYWFHRASHRVSFLWAAHEVHHSSERYNLTTALRQSALQESLSAPFYWPLALLGFPASMLASCIVVSALYQFWIHTRLVGRLHPLFEALFNTPSQHRVHHAADAAYLDRNYAGTFAWWDRLYGTRCPEREEPTYGTVVPLARFSALEANLVGWRKIAANARAARGLAKLYALVAPPEWSPSGHAAPDVARDREALRQELTPGQHRAGLLLVLTVALFAGVSETHAERAGVLAALPLTLWLVAAVLEFDEVLARPRTSRGVRALLGGGLLAALIAMAR